MDVSWASPSTTTAAMSSSSITPRSAGICAVAGSVLSSCAAPSTTCGRATVASWPRVGSSHSSSTTTLRTQTSSQGDISDSARIASGRGQVVQRGRNFVQVSMTVNGSSQSHDVEPRTLLVQYLREDCVLTGTKIGCDTSSCGACTILLDGESVKSCTMFAAQADGASLTTIEGLAPSVDDLHPVQTAFHENHALQCGF